MVTLISCLIWQIISFIFPPNEYGCVYAWITLGNIGTLLLPTLVKKNHLFSWGSFWSWPVCKQAKLSYLGHRKPARTLKSQHTQNESLFGAEAVIVNGDRYRAMLNEFLLKGRILATFVFNRMALCATQLKLHSILNRSCRLLHGQPTQPFKRNYFPLLNERIVLSNKKRNLRKYSVVFLKHFPKKKGI